MKRLTPGYLEAVAHENWNVNQHVDPEVLEDLGYATQNTLARVIDSTLERQEAEEDFSVSSLARQLESQEAVSMFAVEQPRIRPKQRIIPRGRTRGDDGIVRVSRLTLPARARLTADEAPAHVKIQ